MAVPGQKYQVFWRPAGGRVRSMVAILVEHATRGGGTYVFRGDAVFGTVNIPESEFISLGFTRAPLTALRELQVAEDHTRTSN